MRELWQKLHDLFDTDDGSLPEIVVESLAVDRVSAVYEWIRSQFEIYRDHGAPLLWDRVAECDVAIPDLDDPVKLLLDGQVEPFRHGLNSFEFNGVEIPQLTVAVWPTSIAFDYRMGPEWGPSQVAALFDFLWAIQQMAPDARISHLEEGGSQCSPQFTNAWNNFTRGKSATKQTDKREPE